MATEYVYNELTGEFEEREVQPPRFKYFRLRNNKAFLNTPCTIEWEVENASSVSLDRVGPQSLVGFFTFRPHELTSRWTLRAHGEGDSELTLEVKASPLPKIHSFNATQRRNNETYIVGDRIVLNWNAEFYDQIRLNGNDVTGLSSAEVELTSEQNDFEIEAQCEDHISKEQLHIEAYKKPKFSVITSRERLRLGRNEDVTISWNIEDAYSAKLYFNGTTETIPLNGSKTFLPETTTKYKILAVALDQRRSFDVIKKIEVLPEADIFFAASREYTLPGVPLQLSWKIVHGKNANLIGDFNGAGQIPFEGNMTIELESNQTIRLQVEDDFGITESSINIRMLPVPVMKEIQVPTPSLKRTLSIETNVSRPDLCVSAPQYSTIRTIPFVPKMNMPELIVKPSFVDLIKKIPDEPLSVKGWKYINSVTSSLFSILKKSIKLQYENK